MPVNQNAATVLDSPAPAEGLARTPAAPRPMVLPAPAPAPPIPNPASPVQPVSDSRAKEASLRPLPKDVAFKTLVKAEEIVDPGSLALRQCPHCGCKVLAEASSCPNCGRSLTTATLDDVPTVPRQTARGRVVKKSADQTGMAHSKPRRRSRAAGILLRIVILIAFAAAGAYLGTTDALDADHDGSLTVDDLRIISDRAVTALRGLFTKPMPTPAPTPVPTPTASHR
jgi:hypothetical protein